VTHPPDPQMERDASHGAPNSIANLRDVNTTQAEQISQEVVLYLQRRFGLLPATAVVIAELAFVAGYPR
jgi:hypothetical protein